MLVLRFALVLVVTARCDISSVCGFALVTVAVGVPVVSDLALLAGVVDLSWPGQVLFQCLARVFFNRWHAQFVCSSSKPPNGTRVFFFAVVALCWFLLSLRGPRKPVSE